MARTDPGNGAAAKNGGATKTAVAGGAMAEAPAPDSAMAGSGLMWRAMTSAQWAGQMVRASLPPPERLAYYSGLGALAALGILDWPVAGAIGTGVWVATRTRRSGPMPSRAV
jgi:hypothetical protein